MSGQSEAVMRIHFNEFYLLSPSLNASPVPHEAVNVTHDALVIFLESLIHSGILDGNCAHLGQCFSKIQLVFGELSPLSGVNPHHPNDASFDGERHRDNSGNSFSDRLLLILRSGVFPGIVDGDDLAF
jgi:hypothetical protein